MNKKLILPLMSIIVTGCMFFLMVVAYFGYSAMKKNETMVNLHNRRIITQTLRKTSISYNRRIKSFVSKKKLIRMFNNRQRELLYQATFPLFRILKKENPDFSSIIFHDTNNRIFLNMDKPFETLLIDTIQRPDIAMTLDTGHQVSGFSTCHYGMKFNILQPVSFNERIIGVVQFTFAEDFIMRNLKDIIKSPMAILLKKSCYENSSHSTIPGFIDGTWGIRSRSITFFNDHRDQVNWNLDEQSFSSGDRRYTLTRAYTLVNYQGEKKAYILVAQDVTEHYNFMRNQVALVGMICIVICIISFTVMLYFSSSASRLTLGQEDTGATLLQQSTRSGSPLPGISSQQEAVHAPQSVCAMCNRVRDPLKGWRSPLQGEEIKQLKKEICSDCIAHHHNL